MRQSGDPEVIGLSPASGTKLVVGRTSQDIVLIGLFLWPHISPQPGDEIGYPATCGL